MPTMRYFRQIRVAALALALAGAPLSGQQGPAAADVIRGRVTDDSSRALTATVLVTRGPDREASNPTYPIHHTSQVNRNPRSPNPV